MNIFKYTEKLKELYREHPYTHHWHSTINILQYLLYHISVHLYIHLSVSQSILLINLFQSKLQTSVYFPTKHFIMYMSKWVQYLFKVIF